MVKAYRTSTGFCGTVVLDPSRGDVGVLLDALYASPAFNGHRRDRDIVAIYHLPTTPDTAIDTLAARPDDAVRLGVAAPLPAGGTFWVELGEAPAAAGGAAGVGATRTLHKVSLDLRLKDDAPIQAFRGLLHELSTEQRLPLNGTCPPLGSADSVIHATFYTEGWDEARRVAALLSECARSSAWALADPIPSPVVEEIPKPAVLPPAWVYAPGERSPRDTTLRAGPVPTAFPGKPTQRRDAPDGTSTATHEGAHVICQRKYSDALRPLLEEVGLASGSPELDVRIPLKHAAHNAFDDLGFYIVPELLGGSRVLLTFHWRDTYVRPTGDRANAELMKDVAEGRHQDLTGRTYDFHQLRRACLVNEHLVKWCAGVHSDEGSARAALRSSWPVASAAAPAGEPS